MKKRHILLGVVAFLAMGAGAAAYVVSPTVHGGRTSEAPELGNVGAHTIGTTAQTFALEGRTKINAWGMLSGNLEDVEREVDVRFWYPANVSKDSAPITYSHDMAIPGQDVFKVDSLGTAIDGASATTGSKYPLVLMSHGFRGWNAQFSNLAEHIASRGYVVASIEHADAPVEGAASFFLSFGNVLADRSLDQRQVLAQILNNAKNKHSSHWAQIDTENIGLIGYSMGGFGAIATAGAPYDFTANPMSSIPTASQERMKKAAENAAPIKALVAFAPWGGQPDNRVWTAEALKNIKQPVLLVAGQEDDVVNFKEGVTWLYENMTHSDRRMLVYREARHNIVGNDFTLPKDAPFTVSEFLKEPVWRSDRINAINQHFVTAFLDLYLKGDNSKEVFLNVPTVDANDAAWPLSFGEQLNGKLAGPDQQDYWQGFQRRWALGLEMRHKATDTE